MAAQHKGTLECCHSVQKKREESRRSSNSVTAKDWHQHSAGSWLDLERKEGMKIAEPVQME